MVVVVEEPLPPVVKPLCSVLEGPGVGGSGRRLDECSPVGRRGTMVDHEQSKGRSGFGRLWSYTNASHHWPPLPGWSWRHSDKAERIIWPDDDGDSEDERYKLCAKYLSSPPERVT